MFVRDVMRGTCVTVPPHLSWKETAKQLVREHASCAFVVGEDEKLVGILSEKDLFRGIYPTHAEWEHTPNAFHDFETMEQDAADAGGKTARDVMSHRVITTTPETPVLQVGALMVASGIHHVPVVEDGKLIGVVSRGDIYRAILSKYFDIQH